MKYSSCSVERPLSLTEGELELVCAVACVVGPVCAGGCWLG